MVVDPRHDRMDRLDRCIARKLGRQVERALGDPLIEQLAIGAGDRLPARAGPDADVGRLNHVRRHVELLVEAGRQRRDLVDPGLAAVRDLVAHARAGRQLALDVMDPGRHRRGVRDHGARRRSGATDRRGVGGARGRRRAIGGHDLLLDHRAGLRGRQRCLEISPIAGRVRGALAPRQLGDLRRVELHGLAFGRDHPRPDHRLVLVRRTPRRVNRIAIVIVVVAIPGLDHVDPPRANRRSTLVVVADVALFPQHHDGPVAGRCGLAEREQLARRRRERRLVQRAIRGGLRRGRRGSERGTRGPARGH